jgi:hypothetical protein
MKSEHVPVGGDHYKLIREIGAASTILLKNENNQLPLSSSIFFWPILSFSLLTFFGSSMTREDIRGPGIVTYALIGSDAGPAVVGPNT